MGLVKMRMSLIMKVLFIIEVGGVAERDGEEVVIALIVYLYSLI